MIYEIEYIFSEYLNTFVLYGTNVIPILAECELHMPATITYTHKLPDITFLFH